MSQEKRLQRTQWAEQHQRIIELENTLLQIRDKWCPALMRDKRESDKTVCNIVSIEYEIAKVLPLVYFPLRTVK